jgi:S1-C subfamily serine protease
MHVKLAERPSRDDPDRDELASGPRPRVPEPMPDVPLGLTVRELDRRFARQGSDSIQGVMVSRVDPTGAAFSAAIRPDFVIMEINRRPIRSVAHQHVMSREAVTCWPIYDEISMDPGR